MPINTKNISFTNIDFEDFTFSVFAYSDYNLIKESIKNSGVHNLPIVRLLQNGKYAIISGHKRLRALRDLETVTTELIVLDNEIDANLLFINTVLENLSFREYNLCEKSLIINKLSQLPSCEYDIEKVYKALSVNRDNMQDIKGLCKLPEGIKFAIACGKLFEPICYEVVRLESLDRDIFMDFLGNIRFNSNELKEVFNLLKDIFKQGEAKFCDPILSKETNEIVNDRALNMPQKAQRIIEGLRKIKYPKLTKLEEIFKKTKTTLKFPKNIRVKNKSPFEDDNLHLEILIKNTEELIKAANFLTDLSANKDTEDFINYAIGKSKDL